MILLNVNSRDRFMAVWNALEQYCDELEKVIADTVDADLHLVDFLTELDAAREMLGELEIVMAAAGVEG